MHGPHQLYIHLHHLSDPSPHRRADTGHAEVINVLPLVMLVYDQSELFVAPLSYLKFLFDVPEFIHRQLLQRLVCVEILSDPGSWLSQKFLFCGNWTCL